VFRFPGYLRYGEGRESRSQVDSGVVLSMEGSRTVSASWRRQHLDGVGFVVRRRKEPARETLVGLPEIGHDFHHHATVDLVVTDDLLHKVDVDKLHPAPFGLIGAPPSSHHSAKAIGRSVIP